MIDKQNPLALSIPGAAQISSLSVTTLDAAIRAGTLKVKHHGNRTLILMRDLEKFLDSLPSGRPASPPQLEGRRTGRPRKVGAYIKEISSSTSHGN